MLIRRIITQLLILTILFSNFAWAMDECALFQEVSAQEISQISNPPLDEDSENNSCDSRCIGHAKLLYISYRSPYIEFTDTKSNITFLLSFYHSAQGKPPTKPPKV